MKKKINKTLIPFIKHLENKGYTIEKYTDMDNCFGVVGDIIGAFAIVLEGIQGANNIVSLYSICSSFDIVTLSSKGEFDIG